MLASLRLHRNYRLYFAGQFVSQIGTWLQTAAQAWLILDLTHSAQAVGVLGFCFYGPYAVLGLVGGALADRWDRRMTLLAGQIGMTVCAALLAMVVFTNVASVWLIDGIAVIRGTILVFNSPSRQALMVQLVGRSELGNAIALNSSLNNATRIVGPALAGVLIESTGLGWCFALNAISFIPVIVAILAMRPSEFHTHADVGKREPLLQSIRSGLRYARHTKTVAVALSMMFVVSFLAINFNILLPVLARQTMHGSPRVYGTIAAVFGLGALIGALITASRSRASRTLLVVACAVFGVAQLGTRAAARLTCRFVRALGNRDRVHHLYGQHQRAGATGHAGIFARARRRTLQLCFYRKRTVRIVARGLALRARWHGIRVCDRRCCSHRHGDTWSRDAAVADARRHRAAASLARRIERGDGVAVQEHAQLARRKLYAAPEGAELAKPRAGRVEPHVVDEFFEDKRIVGVEVDAPLIIVEADRTRDHLRDLAMIRAPDFAVLGHQLRSLLERQHEPVIRAITLLVHRIETRIAAARDLRPQTRADVRTLFLFADQFVESGDPLGRLRG